MRAVRSLMAETSPNLLTVSHMMGSTGWPSARADAHLLVEGCRADLAAVVERVSRLVELPPGPSLPPPKMAV